MQPFQPAEPLHRPTDALRCGHADRERAVDVIRAAFAEGRLTPEELDARIEQAYRARTYGQLGELVADLPVGPVPFGPAATAAVQPTGARPTAQPAADLPPTVPAWPPAVPQQRPVNSHAVAALVFGLLEFPTAGLTAPAALICGHLARSRIRESGESGAGMATVGVVLGWLAVSAWTLVVVLGLVVVATAAGGLGSFPPPGH